MGSKRTMILIAALVIGALAAVSLYSYVNGIEDRAYKGTKTVTAYVVAEKIGANTSGQQAVEQKLIVPKLVPQVAYPDTALTDPSTIVSKFAKTQLEKGQVVIASMFVDKADTTSTWRDQLDVDEVAVSISLDSVRGLASLLHPGDKVTMLVTLDGSEGGAAAAKAASTGATANPGAAATPGLGGIQFLYSNVDVLAIGSTGVSVSADSSAAPSGGGPITFRVPLRAAEKILLVSSKITLVLEPKGFVPTDNDLKLIDWSQVFEAEKTPYLNRPKPDAASTTTTVAGSTSGGGGTSSTTTTTTASGATTTTIKKP